MRQRLLLSILFVLLALGVQMSAQVTKGSISGTVVDASGAVIPEAQVKATAIATGVVHNTTSDKAGSFVVSQISPGVYMVEISKTGFAKASVSRVNVQVGSDEGLGTVKLGVQQVAENVEVNTEAPLIETTQSQVSSTYSSQSLLTFAGVGENEGLDKLALFAPGVHSSRSNNFSNTNGASISVNGLRGRNNDQQIDGQNNNDNSVGGPSLFLSNNEFVNEYQIVTNNFGPEYGRNAGSVINQTTKQGTNNLHGSIYGTENNSILNGRTNLQKNPQLGTPIAKLPRRNDEFTGMTLGGPIVKDKVFFFTGFDDEIVSGQSQFSSGSRTPTLNGIATLIGCYGNTPALQALAKFGPYAITAGSPTPNNVKIDTTGAIFGSGCKGVEYGGIQRVLPTPVHIFDWLQRADYQSGKNNFSARYLLQRDNSFNATGTGSTGYIGNVPDLNQLTRIDWTRSITDRMTNDLAVSFGRLNLKFGGGTLGTIPSVGNLMNALASVSTGSGNLGFGPATNLPQSRFVNTWQAQDNFQYLWGNHLFKAGVNWTYQRSPNTFLPNINGSYSFVAFKNSSGVTIPAWQNFARNNPQGISIAMGNPTLDFREYDTFGYVGDDWKLKQNLTLNLGLTYTYYGQPENLFNAFDTKRETGSTPFWNPALPLSVRTAAKIPGVNTSFAPRVGFAWTPKFGFFSDGKTVVRGGYSLSYDPPYYNIYLNEATSAPQLLSQTLSANTGLPGMPAVPTGTNVRTALASSLKTGVFDPRSFNQTFVSPNFGPDHVNSWSFGVQREMMKNMVAEIRYVGNQGRNLFQSIDANPKIAALAANFPNLVPAGETPCAAANAVVPSAVGRVNCNEGIIRERTNTGYSDYNGLQAELRSSNLFNQLTLQTSYTWSKTTDNVSEIFGTSSAGTTTAFSQNPSDYTKGEHGTSGLDIPNDWTVNFTEYIPFFKSQHGLVGHVLGGWGVGGNYIIASGQPYSPLQAALAAAVGTPDYSDSTFNKAFFSGGVPDNLRPFLSNPNAPVDAIGQYDKNGNLINYVTGAATSKDKVRFIVNDLNSQKIFGTPFGTAGRNSLRDFWTNTANANLFKTTKLNEKFTATFHADLQNAFNHRNFASVDPFVDDAGLVGNSTGFGHPEYTNGGARTITFGARIGW